MGRPPRELTPLESALHFFGAELRHWRTLSELSQTRLGERTHDSGSLIGKIEKAERFPTRELAQRMDQALTTGGVLARLWPQVEQERVARAAALNHPTTNPEPIPADLGLVWSTSTAATVEAVGKLWRADMQRRSVLISAAWVASAFAEPIREWLLDQQDDLLQERSGRAVGQSDVDAVWAMCEAFADADHRLGGGYARDTLLHYVNQVVFPLLRGSYSGAIGRDLMAATARLCGICGYMSFDSGRQGLAQRYYIQGLRLAQTSGNRALGAHILTDMSDQAAYLGNTMQALELASAGYHTAVDCGAASTAARCAAAQGECHALRGEHQASAQACVVAENLLDRVAPTGERSWMYGFTPDDLTTRRLFMSRDLGRAADVQALAPTVLASSTGRARRSVLCKTALAASYLPTAANPHSDIDRSCELLGEVLPSLTALHSARSLERVNTVRRALAPYATRPSVQDFEDRFRATLTTADPRS